MTTVKPRVGGLRRLVIPIAILVLASLAGVPGHSERVLQATSSGGETWRNYTDGNFIRALAVDQRSGDVWAGTWGGVIVWNAGNGTYTTFTASDGLGANDVNVIAFDVATGDRWFGTEGGGVSRLSAEGEWTTFTTADGLSHNAVQAIAIDASTGDRWFGTWGGASRLSEGGEWQTYTIADGLGHDWVQAIAIDAATGDRWFGTLGGGVSRLSATGDWQTFTSIDGLGDNGVASIAIDAATGDRWFGTTNSGVSRLSAEGKWQTFTVADGLTHDTVDAIAIDVATGDTWFAGSGVSRLSASGEWQSYTEAEGLPTVGVSSIAIDSTTGDKWFGSSGRGVIRLSVRGDWATFATSDGPRLNDVWAIAIDPVRGETWFATGWIGVSRLSAAGEWKAFTSADGLRHSYVHAIAIDADTGDRWFGTHFGASRLSADGEWQSFTTADGLGGNDVRAVAIDPATGDRWFGTDGGVSRLSASDEWETFTTADGLGANSVLEIAMDPATGDVWFGTYGGGVSRRSADGAWTTYTEADGLGRNTVDAIAIDGATGDRWFATRSRGASRLSARDEWSRYTTDAGLVSNEVQAIAIDSTTGDVWFGTADGGVSRLSTKGEWRAYTTTDGLGDDYVNAIEIDPVTGDRWFGTNNGVAVLLAEARNVGCMTATALDITDRISASLDDPGSSDYYYVDVDRPFTHITATVPDSSDLLEVEIFRECVTTAGPGSGRHIGPGTGRHIGGLDRAEWDVTFNTGRYFIVVSPTSSIATFPLKYSLQVSMGTPDLEATRTLILAQERQLADLWNLDPSAVEMVALREDLLALAQHRAGNAIFVGNIQTDTDVAVELAYLRWLDDPADVSRANSVARALRDWITKVRAVLPNLRYVVLAGDDRVIPHLRLPIVDDSGLDRGWVRESQYMASGGIDPESSVGSALAHDFSLTDDVYSAPAPASWGQGQDIYVPEIAVGRLVERPSDMSAIIEAYLALEDASTGIQNGTVSLNRAVTAGYDFMQDAVEQSTAVLESAGLGDSGIARLWGSALTAPALRQGLFMTRADLAFLGVHADHGAFQLADRQFMREEGISAATADLSGTLAYAMACHAGLNVPGDEHARPKDIPEAWQRRGVTWVGSTGWAYGLPKFIAYQEDLMTELTRQLMANGGSRVGDALVAAKRDYYVSSELDPMDVKTLAGTILYGLPMLRMRVPDATDALGNTDVPATPMVPAADDDRLLRLVAPDVWLKDGQPVRFRTSDFVPVSDPDGTWTYYTLSDRLPRADAGEPVQPIYRESLGAITLDEQRTFGARGVVLTRATYRDEADFTPLIQQAERMGEDRQVAAQTAEFDLAGWYPRQLLSLRVLYHNDHSGDIDPARTQAELLIHAGQYNGTTATERLFEELLVDEYYSASSDRIGPQIADVALAPVDGGVDVSLTATDESEILRVVVAYVAPAQPWLSTELQAADGRLWTGRLSTMPENYLLQVVDKAGNVTTLDDRGQLRRPRVGDTVEAGTPWTIFLPQLANE